MKTRRGLVIVVAVNDRKYFIAPGKGLEGDLTDVECDDIARECIVRNMKVNDVDRALLSTVRALYGKFKTGKVVVDDDEVDDEDGGAVLLVMLVLLFCFGRPVCLMVLYVLEKLGLRKPRPKKRRHRDNDDWFPPFFLGGGGGFGSGGGFSGGGSFGGGSFGGGGAGGGW